jgi:hypothetical protein
MESLRFEFVLVNHTSQSRQGERLVIPSIIPAPNGTFAMLMKRDRGIVILVKVIVVLVWRAHSTFTLVSSRIFKRYWMTWRLPRAPDCLENRWDRRAWVSVGYSLGYALDVAIFVECNQLFKGHGPLHRLELHDRTKKLLVQPLFVVDLK